MGSSDGFYTFQVQEAGALVDVGVRVRDIVSVSVTPGKSSRIKLRGGHVLDGPASVGEYLLDKLPSYEFPERAVEEPDC